MTIEQLRVAVEEIALRKLGPKIKVLIESAGTFVEVRIKVLPPGEGTDYA